jgi:hypothetical protein
MAASLDSEKTTPESGASLKDEVQKIERLEAAVEYLLIASLNAGASRETGQVSNVKLTAFFLKLVLLIRPKIFRDRRQ